MGEQPASSISADFLTGSTLTGLDRIRTRLLDLTNRNKLLNFRHSNSSSLRVVEARFNSVFEGLRDNERFVFLPVPEPDHNADAEQPLATNYAASLGWRTSFDLNGNSDFKRTYLPVLQYQEQLDILSRKIAAAAKTAIEESGTNMLYLIFGFLEWYESENSDQSHLAPLIAVPVTLERSGGKGKAVEAVIEYSGEDIETNLSLVEKMRRDFGLEIPPLEDEDDPDTYFEKFQNILKLRKGWAIKRHLSLALLSFGKLLMYRDLDPKNWPEAQNIATHPLVKELFEGSKVTNVTRAEEFDIDDPQLKKDIPDLIRDADSSQHSALIHALRGQNLVIEGPPGTGKSQTITNLIAAALEKGKNVLFVAEKLVALEVVRRRLDDAGLGMFCLEVHSHKTKKGALLADLARRLQLRDTFKDPRDLDKHLSIVDDRKKRLTQYAALINKSVEPLKASIFDILWARDRCGQESGAHRDRLGQILFRFATEYTQGQLAETEQFLSVYAQHLTAILLQYKSIDLHPWNWIARPLSFGEEDQIVSDLEQFVETIETVDACCDHLEQNAGIYLGRTIDGLSQSASVLGLLPGSKVQLLEQMLIPCRTAENRVLLHEFTWKVESYRHRFADLQAAIKNPVSLLNAETAEKLSRVVAVIGHWGLDGLSVAEIKKLLKTSTETAVNFQSAQFSFRCLLDFIGCEAPFTLSGAAFLLATLAIVDDIPAEILTFRQPAFEHEAARMVLASAWQEANALKLTETILARDFDLSPTSGGIPAKQLIASASTINEASTFQRLFGRNYSQAVKHYRLIALKKSKAPQAKMSQALRAVAEYSQKLAQFESQRSYRETFGELFRGVNSPWQDLHKTIIWYEYVFQALPEHQPSSEPFRRVLFSARSERIKAIKATLGALAEHRAIIDRTVSRAADFKRALPSQRLLWPTGSFEEVLSSVQRFNLEVGKVIQAFDGLSVSDDVSLKDIPNILMAASQCRSALADIQNRSELRTLLKDLFRGVNTDVEPIKHTVQLAESLASGSLPPKTVEWLLCEDYTARLSQLRSSLNTAKDCGEILRALAERLETLSASSFWNVTSGKSWTVLRALAQNGLVNREELSRWSHYIRLRIKSAEIGVDRLTGMAESRTLHPEELGLAFRYAFYNSLARNVFTQNAELSQVTGLTQEQLLHQFAAADKESVRLYSERVAAQIDKRQIPFGNQSGPVRSWTEMALILNEINKQKRHLPIRQLILRSCNALLALKPCFMMGPLSVAQYLAPGKLRFDLVIMDEASQLKPEDAIGALARGGQVVIVGDPWQLPPTTFFQRVSLDGEDETIDDSRTAIEEGESILNVASTLFQPVRLRWHYRSRHHSLIAFSNQEFYDRNLIIFPSAYHDDPCLGVKHHFVIDGVFDSGRNPREAAVVVDAVLDHMRQHPTESLGVVTLNFEQRELVEELLDQRLRDDPAAIAFQERMKGGQETLFVKNLENVQGDERDVIFISTTYGPDARGNQFQRFGPINGKNGHRRLNVLFTRSKSRTVVFSSLDPDRIQTTASSPWGLRVLKDYLIYARTGILQRSDEALDQPTNDFEKSVGTVLKEKGYEVVPQVGVAGFFIDLGVKHPAKPGAYLLGIECDGASYHSARSARDRDRLRQEILVNLGWKIHRVWSTDWFRSRDSEVKRLLRTIEALLERDPAFLKQREKTHRAEGLRKQLEILRDEEIARSFPDTPPTQNLLTDILLEQFLQKRPKTRGEWFSAVSPELRASIDSRQVGKYLDKILEIITSSEI